MNDFIIGDFADNEEQEQDCDKNMGHKYVDSGGETTVSMAINGTEEAIGRDTVFRQVLGGAIAEYYNMPASAGHVYQLRVDTRRRRLSQDTGVERRLAIRWQIRASDADAAWSLKKRITMKNDVSDLKLRLENALTSTTNKMILSKIRVLAVHDNIAVQRNPVMVLSEQDVDSDNTAPPEVFSESGGSLFRVVRRNEMDVEFSRPDGSKPTPQDLKDEPGLVYVLQRYFAGLKNYNTNTVVIEKLGVEQLLTRPLSWGEDIQPADDPNADFRLTVDWALVRDPQTKEPIATDVEATTLMKSEALEDLADTHTDEYVKARFVNETRNAAQMGILSVVVVTSVKTISRSPSRIVASVPYLCRIEGVDTATATVSVTAKVPHRNIFSPHSCAKKCFDTTSCQSFLWGRESSTEHQRDCYLFDSILVTDSLQEQDPSPDFWFGTPCNLQEPSHRSCLREAGVLLFIHSIFVHTSLRR